MKLHTRLLSTTAVSAAAALTLLGCTNAAAHERGPDDPLRVVATTTQVGDFASRIGGADIELTTLLVPGASVHHFDPSPGQLLALGRADVLVESGAGLEGFIDGAVEASGFSGAVITAADGVDLAAARAITARGDDPDHEGHDHGGHSHEADGHGGHDHGSPELNPHLWTSPSFARGMVTEITAGLAAADPDHAAEFRQRAAAYLDQLSALDGWITEQFAQVPEDERLFVSGHDAMSYFLHDYGITFVGSLLPGFEDHAEPSAAQLDALIAAIRELGVKAVFTESSISPKLAETVARETGAQWVSGADALYVDALGPHGSGADTYLSATVHNTRTIIEAWGFRTGPLPAVLQSF